MRAFFRFRLVSTSGQFTSAVREMFTFLTRKNARFILRDVSRTMVMKTIDRESLNLCHGHYLLSFPVIVFSGWIVLCTRTFCHNITTTVAVTFNHTGATPEIDGDEQGGIAQRKGSYSEAVDSPRASEAVRVGSQFISE